MVDEKVGRSSRLLICGSRTWSNEALIRSYLVGLPKDTIVIIGEHWGVDAIVAKCARELGLKLEIIPNDWFCKGKASEKFRARLILIEREPTLVFIFDENYEDNKDSKDMVEACKAYSVPYDLVTSE